MYPFGGFGRRVTRNVRINRSEGAQNLAVTRLKDASSRNSCTSQRISGQTACQRKKGKIWNKREWKIYSSSGFVGLIKGKRVLESQPTTPPKFYLAAQLLLKWHSQLFTLSCMQFPVDKRVVALADNFLKSEIPEEKEKRRLLHDIPCAMSYFRDQLPPCPCATLSAEQTPSHETQLWKMEDDDTSWYRTIKVRHLVSCETSNEPSK